MWMLYSAVYLDAFLEDDQREIFANDISLSSSFGCCSPKKKTNLVTQTCFYRSQEEMSVSWRLCVGWWDESESRWLLICNKSSSCCIWLYSIVLKCRVINLVRLPFSTNSCQNPPWLAYAKKNFEFNMHHRIRLKESNDHRQVATRFENVEEKK